MEQTIDRQPPMEATDPEVLCVGGGKGGVGKTCFSVNVALEVARRGWRVVLVDGDLSCANVQTVLGMEIEDRRLDDFFYLPGGNSLAPALYDSSYDNLQVIPNTNGLLDLAKPSYEEKVALIRELRQLEVDLVIIDLDAGAHISTLDMFLMADTNAIVVITPEKTSIDNAFKFLRGALFRRVERFYQSQELALLLQRNENLREFVERIKNSRVFAPETKRQICGELLGIALSIKPKIVVNRAHNAYEAQIAANILAKMARHHLLVQPEMLGFLQFDSRVTETVNAGKPFIVRHPQRKLAASFGDIANRLGYI